MTVVTASVAYHQNNLNLDFLKSGINSFVFVSGSSLDPLKVPTNDGLVINETRGGKDFSAMIVGRDLAYASDAPNDVTLTSGRVFDIADFAVSGTTSVKTISFEGFDLAASFLWKAVESTDKADDLMVIKKMLGGNDVFALLKFNDYANGFRGADRMYGQDGNDTLFGDEGGDRLYGGDGNDSLTGGEGSDLLDGGLLSDVLFGGAGDDRLTNSLGNDTLSGGDGKDVFVFTSKTGIDHITDFTSATDQISFSKKIFAGFGAAGALAENAFYAASGAVSGHLATDRVIYDTSSGALYYDADGNKAGGVAAVQIAVLDGHPTLAYTDVLIF